MNVIEQMIAIEDIFIGLAQAEAKQKLKDKFDEYSQYEFYKVFSFDKVCDKILTAIATLFGDFLGGGLMVQFISRETLFDNFLVVLK